mmetsp:Transcript_22582/g.36832  ORF Transcript_22582/g.36832 Transcript_22582/m.36832 type:complete len:202 (+) Transcript_22582:532-1137(+)
MRGQDCGDAVLAQLVHNGPHVLAQLHVDTCGRFIQKQNAGFMRQSLGNQHAALHAAGQLADLCVPFVPKRQTFQDILYGIVLAPFAKKTPGKAHRVDHPFKRLQRDLLRHQPNQAARLAVVLENVKPRDRDRARGRHGNAADRRDQRCLAGAVRTKQSNNLALFDVDRHTFKRLESARVGFAQVFDTQNRGHSSSDGKHGW